MSKLTKKERERLEELAIMKMELPPYSLVGDSKKYRAGYIRALQDLGIIDGLTATRMLIEVEKMELQW